MAIQFKINHILRLMHLKLPRGEPQINTRTFSYKKSSLYESEPLK
jgi:hypothetical protein